MPTTSASIVHLLVLGASVVNAIALSDFRPAVSDLPSTCNKAYRAQIAGCQASDFQSGTGCSAPCVQGLLQINNDVASACQTANVAGNSIVGIFLAGKGIRALCNIEVVTKTLGTAPAQAPTQAPTTPSPTPPTTTATPITTTTIPSQPTALTTSTTTALKTTQSPGTTGISKTSTPPIATTSISSVISSATLTTATSSPLSSPSASTQASSPTPLAASQGVNTQPLPLCANSGGGSPFDAAPGRDCRSAASSIRITASNLALIAGLLSLQLLS